jgi:hypothetical protein
MDNWTDKKDFTLPDDWMQVFSMDLVRFLSGCGLRFLQDLDIQVFRGFG